MGRDWVFCVLIIEERIKIFLVIDWFVLKLVWYEWNYCNWLVIGKRWWSSIYFNILLIVGVMVIGW